MIILLNPILVSLFTLCIHHKWQTESFEVTEKRINMYNYWLQMFASSHSKYQCPAWYILN